MKRCLICDDHALLGEALAGMVLAAWPRAEITLVANFSEALAAAEDGHDFCLSDLRMPGAEPLEGIRGLRAAAPDMPLMVVTGTADDREMLALLAMGVAGFVNKTASSAVLEAAIRLVLAGGRYVPERLAELVPGTGRSASAGPVRLTTRQREVITLVGEGLSNKEIARELGIAPSSVKTHLTAAQDLLGSANRAQTSNLARTYGLL